MKTSGSEGTGTGERSARPAMISVLKATKAFGNGVVAFKDLTVEVASEEILCIVGPSGCGKTTLLRCIGGLTPLTEGSIRIGGQEVTRPPRNVAIVFQHFGLFPWMTVEANVAYGLKVAGVKRQERLERARQYIRLVGLEGFERRYPYQLSGGMQQRVGLARALAVEPEVLLMDEPFASVDAQTRELLQEQLLQIWETHRRTMVFVTHSIEEAILMGDRVAVLSTRPGQVKEVIEVPFGRPRRISGVFQDPRFGPLRNHVWQTLRAYASAELARVESES
ncbi:MAG TPA: ABC transporter ATP-binding protein [Actinomycetota bacterium]|nr:ABC transporter ATP-binding protein [Actinomycetota bacterium]